MASHLRKRWDANFQGMSRRDRRGCDYDAYLADPLADWDLSIPADVAADLFGSSEARALKTEKAIDQLRDRFGKAAVTTGRGLKPV